VNPDFETQSDVLQRTIIGRAGEQIPVAKASLNAEYVAQRNAAIEWV
jgi:putative restriction endonuclease